jgi:proteasome-associated ATPase
MEETKREAKLRTELEKAQGKLLEMGGMLKDLLAPPNVRTTAIDTVGDRTIIMMKGDLVEIPVNPEVEVSPGDEVILASEGLFVAEVRNDPYLFGKVGTVRAVHPTFCIVAVEATDIIVNVKKGLEIEEGDRVLLDPDSRIIKAKLPNDTARVKTIPNTTWDDIGGLEGVKDMMREIVEDPFTFAALYKHYNKKPPKGVLLFGPPGCGKTMVGRAVANALAKGNKENFKYVKGPEILNPFVGVSEQNIRQMFSEAKRFKAKHGVPLVIFIDEAEAILSKRGTGISSDMDKTIVPMFLAEMDGLEESGALVILATNRADRLDPAVVRDGRVDRKIEIPRPNFDETRAIFSIYLNHVPTSAPAEVLAEGCTQMIFEETRVLYELQTKDHGRVDFTLQHIVSGSMVANVVDRATSYAIKRDKKSKTKSGVEMKDLECSINDSYTQASRLNHEDEIKEFSEKNGVIVVGQRRKDAKAVAAGKGQDATGW